MSLTKDELLAPLAAHRGDAVVVTTMGMVRPWARYSASPLDFASADSAMGHAADFALGIALAQPARRVVCLNGDGSMLMTLGTLVLAAQSGAANYLLFVVRNDTYEITGNQAVPGAGQVDYAALARGAGFRSVFAFADAAEYLRRLPEVLAAPGPTFVVADVEPGAERPLSRAGGEAAACLRMSLAEAAHGLRAALAK